MKHEEIAEDHSDITSTQACRALRQASNAARQRNCTAFIRSCNPRAQSVSASNALNPNTISSTPGTGVGIATMPITSNAYPKPIRAHRRASRHVRKIMNPPGSLCAIRIDKIS